MRMGETIYVTVLEEEPFIFSALKAKKDMRGLY